MIKRPPYKFANVNVPIVSPPLVVALVNPITGGLSTYDPYTVFLGHFDGLDAATAAVDSARSGDAPHTIVFSGTAQLDTASKALGSAALVLDGNSDYVTIADSPDLTFPGDLTIEKFINTNVIAAGDWLDAWTMVEDGNNHLLASVVHTGGDAGKFYIFMVIGSVVKIELITTAPLVVSTWYHTAVVRSGDTWKLWLGGVEQSVLGGRDTYEPSFNFVSPFRIGAYAGTPARFWNGSQDEYRISNGKARYTEPFTPPTKEFKP